MNSHWHSIITTIGIVACCIGIWLISVGHKLMVTQQETKPPAANCAPLAPGSAVLICIPEKGKS